MTNGKSGPLVPPSFPAVPGTIAETLAKRMTLKEIVEVLSAYPAIPVTPAPAVDACNFPPSINTRVLKRLAIYTANVAGGLLVTLVRDGVVHILGSASGDGFAVQAVLIIDQPIMMLPGDVINCVDPLAAGGNVNATGWFMDVMI